MSEPLEAATKKLSQSTQRLVFLGFLLLCAGFLYVIHVKVAKHSVRFSPDSVNYVSVARHIAAGEGWKTSFLMDTKQGIIEWRIHQPPGYPAAIAFLILLGFPPEQAALWVSFASHLLLLALFAFLGHVRGGTAGAVAASALYAMFWPLAYVAVRAWSETTFILLTAACVFLTQTACSRAAAGRTNLLLMLGAGLVAGLSCTVRYIGAISIPFLLITLLLSALVLRGRPGKRILCLGLAIAAAISAAVLAVILAVNLLHSGSMTGARPPSDVSFSYALRESLKWASRDMLPSFPFLRISLYRFGTGEMVPGAILYLVVLAASCRAASRKHDPSPLLPVLWATIYYFALCWAASRSHFDSIDTRLLSPMYALLTYALVENCAEGLRSIRRPGWGVFSICAFCILFLSGQEGHLHAVTQEPPRAPWPAREEAVWLLARTDPGEIIMTTRSHLLGRLLPDRKFLSVPYPPVSEGMDPILAPGDIRSRGTRYGVRFLVLFKSRVDPRVEANGYGPYIAYLIAGGRPAEVALRRESDQALIFEILPYGDHKGH